MPGKTSLTISGGSLESQASMRPQRNAGENERHRNPPSNPMAASMRPQRNAGENVGTIVNYQGDLWASMRPQRNAGENVDHVGLDVEFVVASMRPQRNAGENPAVPAPCPAPRSRFNEAPAKCRGKRVRFRAAPETANGFNEAPAKCRGKREAAFMRLAASERCSFGDTRGGGENVKRHSCALPPSRLQ